jgi:hypothetical protein
MSLVAGRRERLRERERSREREVERERGRERERSRERERHDTPTWELRSNLGLLGVNLLKQEPANEKSYDPAAARQRGS